jgi:large subunit ribosomal protein L21
MYAVIEQGGKQYKVSEGDKLEVELVDVPAEVKNIELDKVLLVSDGKKVKLGKPYLEGAKVVAAFETNAAEAIIKGKKLYPTNFRKRKNSKRRIGHRQKFLRVVIEKIVA